MQKTYLEIGRIVGVHGIHGACRVQPWCDGIDALKQLTTVYIDGAVKTSYHVEKIRAHGNQFLITFREIISPEQAALLRNCVLLAPRSEISVPKDRVFIQDLIGLPVFRADDGVQLGILTDVLEYPGQQIYQVQTQKGEVLVPAVPAFLEHIDVQHGIFLHVIPGMFA